MLQTHDEGKTGTLYLVGTPIGNFEDMTFRGLRILREADAVYCEDTRRTLQLLKHFKIERDSGIDSFHDHSPRGVLAKIKAQLEEGKSVAYVTDSGMPVISDPGFVLVRAARECGAAVTAVPGPSAASMLFALSGLASPKFFFHGFFPRTRGEVERVLEVVRDISAAHLFYEAPGRIGTSLEIVARNMPDAEVVVGRELTKMHEEVLRGSAEKVFAELGAREKVKGECVVAILGGQNVTAQTTRATAAPEAESGEGETGAAAQVVELTDEQKTEITALVKSGVSSKDAAKTLSKKYRVPRRVIYEFIIRHLT